MADLTSELNHPWREGQVLGMKMAAVKIYKGAMVGLAAEVTKGLPDTGYVTNMRVGNTNAYLFCGVAEETVDNSSGAAGARTIMVRRTGCIRVAKSSAAQTDVGRVAHVADNQTVEMTNTTGKEASVGWVYYVPNTTQVDLVIDQYTAQQRIISGASSPAFPHYRVEQGGP